MQEWEQDDNYIRKHANVSEHKEHIGDLVISSNIPFAFSELKSTFLKFPPNFALAVLYEATQVTAPYILEDGSIPPLCCLSLRGDSVASLSKRKSEHMAGSYLCCCPFPERRVRALKQSLS